MDPEVFAALPAELQKELKAAYDQRQRQGENSAQQQPAGAPGKPALEATRNKVKCEKESRCCVDYCSV